MVWLVKGLLEQPCEDTEDFAFWCLKVTLPPRPTTIPKKIQRKVHSLARSTPPPQTA